MLAIFLPSYNRAHKLAEVAKNIEEATKSPFTLYFGLEKDDKESIKVAKKTGHKVVINTSDPSFSNAIQAIYEQSSEEIFIPANDDFLFLDGWDVEPLKMMEDENIGVLGVHDGNPATSFSSISFIRRKYIEEQSGVIDIPNRVLYPYNHNFVDNELTDTAKHRGRWAACPAPCIKHLHPSFNWLGEFPTDTTYEKNDSKFVEDSNIYNSRKHLWS